MVTAAQMSTTYNYATHQRVYTPASAKVRYNYMYIRRSQLNLSSKMGSPSLMRPKSLGKIGSEHVSALSRRFIWIYEREPNRQVLAYYRTTEATSACWYDGDESAIQSPPPKMENNFNRSAKYVQRPWT